MEAQSEPTIHDARMWAQISLRAFAAATNCLIPGRRFVLVNNDSISPTDPRPRALVDLLSGFGAHVEWTELAAPLPLSSSSSTSASTQAVVYVSEDGADHSELQTLSVAHHGAVLVDTPLGGRPVVVYSPNLEPMSPPHAASNKPDYGVRRIEWARSRMPVTRKMVDDLAADGLIQGRKIGVSLVLEPKTAALAQMLHEAGAKVSVFGHADETRDDVAAALRAGGVDVFADSSADALREEELARGFLGSGVEFLLDDGSHLIRMAHDPSRAPGALDMIAGAGEETTSGVRPLRGFDLRFPVLSANDARSKTLFDNAYATGQSCLLTILDLLDPTGAGVPLEGESVVVIGYGDVGKGFARFTRACGAKVTVVELDPVRELQALMDGYRTASLENAVTTAVMVVSATGEPSTIPVSAMERMRPGTVLAVAGGVTGEIELDEAEAAGWVMSDAPGLRAVQLLSRGCESVGGQDEHVDASLAGGGRAWSGFEPIRAGESASERATTGQTPNLGVPRRSFGRPSAKFWASLAGEGEGQERGHEPRLVVLDRGGCINCTAGEGNPIEIMDISFGVQLACLRELLTRVHDLEPGLHQLPKTADDLVAKRALEALR
ncbi:adenosylhomocysteinase [Schaalia vaccimaxillae]|uniref:adenosylhomocysteinase n=1 Tax=Schaalia vaccimaxillae TaxID=183916 RepID=UPI000415B492|nr:adenosylhomocysteinase [Schaalia vaccimaxillae]